jgi:hypothetical protein
VSQRHPTMESLWEVARTQAAGRVEEHASRCRQCADELRLASLVVASATAIAACPDEIELVLMADGALRDASIVQHVEACAACARSVESLQEAGSVASVAHRSHRSASVVTRVSDALLAALSRLASTEMPVAFQIATRGAAARRDDAVDRGMRAYRGRRWPEAAGHFDAAFRAGSESADSALLLGACLRRLGRPADACAVLRRASESRPSASEPRWQLVQALLEAGDAMGALTELERLARKPGPRRDAARSLAREVRSALEGA